MARAEPGGRQSCFGTQNGSLGRQPDRGPNSRNESESLMSIRVILADDHKIVRDGLKSMLAKQLDIEVVGEADNGRDAVSVAGELMPDVVVMDIGMRDLNGIEATRILAERHPEIRVVALSMHSDKRYVSEMLAAGASAYLLKDGAFEELATAIRAAAEGQRYLSPGVADIVVDDYVSMLSGDVTTHASGQIAALSGREREVLQLIAEGKSTKEIAALLHLSVKTVETHRRQLMEKLNIFNIAGLTRFALREGLITLED
jgi:two-component system, NarL family, response regulator NreC